MQFGWSKTRYSPIGVDFGVDCLKVMQTTLTDPPQLVAAGQATVPAEARADQGTRYAFYVEALRSLLKLQPFQGRRAIISLPAYQTLVQHLQIAPGDEDSLDTQVELHFRQRLNVDFNRMVARSFCVGQVVRDGSPRLEVLCLAASREAVMRSIAAAQAAKLDVVGMRSEPEAVLRAFVHLFRRQDDQQRTTCFLDIGAATTKVVIAHGGQMAFAKTIHAAGDHFTRQYAQALNLDLARADQQRRQQASPARADAEAAGPAAAPAAVAVAPAPGKPSRSGLAVLDAAMAAETGGAAAAPAAASGPPPRQPESEALDCLIDELQLCVRYHQSLFANRPLERLIFLGGEAHHVDLCQKVARALRIGAQLGDPLARVTWVGKGAPTGLDLRRPQPAWAVPLGLCLCEANV